MRTTTPDFITLSVAVVIAAAAAGVLLFSLSNILRPADAAMRLDALEQQGARLKALVDRRGDPSAYRAGAVCIGAGDRASETLRQEIVTDAKRAGVDLSNLELSPGSAIDGPMRLTPISVRLDASGRYDAILAMVGLLARADPELFVDAVDLRSKVSTVDLKLSGRVYCPTSDPL